MKHQLTGIKNLSQQAQESIENVLYSENAVLSEQQKTELATAKELVKQVYQLALEIQQEYRSLNNDPVCIENLLRRI